MVFLGKLKALLETNEAYAILDDTQAKGCTWTAGGCALLALALRGLLPEAQVYRLGSDQNPIEHVLVRIPDGQFVDGDGVSTEATLRRRWTKLERLTGSTLAPLHWWGGSPGNSPRRRGCPRRPPVSPTTISSNKRYITTTKGYTLTPNVNRP